MTSQLRQCEASAQELYDQCRTSTGPWHELRKSLRKLRNILGDLDEIWHNGRMPAQLSASRCVSQCAILLVNLGVAISSSSRSKPHGSDVDFFAFEAELISMSLELLTAYEQLTTASKMSLEMISAASFPPPVSISAPPSVETISLCALSNTHQPIPSLACDTGQDIPRVSPIDVKPSSPLVDNDAAHRLVVQELQKRLRTEPNPDVAIPTHKDTSPAALEKEFTTSSCSRMSSVEIPNPISYNDANVRLLNTARDALTGRSAAPIRRPPPEVPPKKLMTPVCPRRDPPPPPLPDRHKRSMSADQSCVVTNLPKDSYSPTSGLSKVVPRASPKNNAPLPRLSTEIGRPERQSCRDEDPLAELTALCHDTSDHTSGEHAHRPKDICPGKGSLQSKITIEPREEFSLSKTRNDSTTEISLSDPKRVSAIEPTAYGYTPMTSTPKDFLDVEFGGPSDLDLTLIVGRSRAASPEPPLLSRPAKAKAIAMEQYSPEQCLRPNLLRRSRTREIVSSPKQPDTTPQTLPSRWRGDKGKRIRRLSSPCSTIRESIATRSFSSPRFEQLNAISAPHCPAAKPQNTEDCSLPSRDESLVRGPASSDWACNSRLLRGVYAPETDPTSSTVLDHERIQHIVNFLNNSSWDLAENYLRGFHVALLERQQDQDCARRVQHLIAVCASLSGNVDVAITRFIACLRTPIISLEALDDGDCASAYWLGDLYAMQNRRVEAGVAYALAEKAALSLAYTSNLHAEREAVQLGFHADANAETGRRREDASSILGPDILSTELARSCITRSKSDEFLLSSSLSLQRTRSNHLHPASHSDDLGVSSKNRFLSISAQSFDASAPWPMPYDPLFAMANVQHGRLQPDEGHILVVPNTASALKLPRLLSVHTLDCFSCGDLAWLISTLRACLKSLEIDYAEVVDSEGIRFCCRYSYMQRGIATTHYFPIALLRHPLWPGHYVANIRAEDDMCSSRLIGARGKGQKGVRYGEARRVRKLIKLFLELAAKERKV